MNEMEATGITTSPETNDEYDESDKVDDSRPSVSRERTAKSPRKLVKHKSKSRRSSVSTVLEGLEDDIIVVDSTETLENEAARKSMIELNVSEKLYVQNTRGFRAVSRDKIYEESLHKISQSQDMDTKQVLSPHEFALYLHHKTRLFFSFCHGILGGMGFAHMTLVLSIADTPEAVKSFAEGYPDFSRVVQILYYILSAVCFVSVLDRCDFAGLKCVQFVQFLKYRLADVLTIIFYVALLLTTIVCVPWDDRLALSPYNKDLWSDSKVFQSEFMNWKIMSVLRGFFAVAGYIAMFFGPGDDLFFVYLYNMFKQKGNNGHVERF